MKNVCFLLLFVASHSLAQNHLTNVSKGRILTNDGYKIQFANLEFGTENHRYQLLNDHVAKEINATEVYKIEQQTGTEAGKWALWLGLSGLVGSLLGVAQANVEAPSYGAKANNSIAAPLVIGITGLSAGIGALIGSGKKKYKTVYTNPQFGTNESTRKVELSLKGSRQLGYGVGLSWQLSK